MQPNKRADIPIRGYLLLCRYRTLIILIIKPLYHRTGVLFLQELAMQDESLQQRIITMALLLLDKQLKRKSVIFPSTTEVKQYLRLQLEQQERELFMVMHLDNQHRLIHCETASLGTLNQTAVYPREIVKTALYHNTAAVILAHNHPSGIPEPSNYDRQMTDRVRTALNLIDVKVLDHIVLGQGAQVSFAERGWL
ncbi:DNA repair protein RadC [Yersinia frederiksenii ATCC 33641]|nr:DNA repair protein RadC [Yersinia frederiksenii]EEQ12929.1 DNA repair protein RadC [Yersinia frederiksenii ATCC 33641]